MRLYGKIISVIAAAATLLCLSACGQSDSNTSSAAESTQQSSTSQSSTDVSSAMSETAQSSPAESETVQNSPQESREESKTSGNESSGGAEQSGVTEMSTYGLEGLSHPDYIVGKWSLRLETSDLEGEKLDDANDRMASTSMVLAADGTATGIYKESLLKGYWGEENGYVYISFTGDEPETFGYIIDTLVSVNYQGMTFVK